MVGGVTATDFLVNTTAAVPQLIHAPRGRTSGRFAAHILSGSKTISRHVSADVMVLSPCNGPVVQRDVSF